MIETPTAPALDTKTRILDTAERLFSENGIRATSLRSVISEAQVNLAAVHYHFRSKDSLIEAVVMRRVGAVNQQRLAMLEAFEMSASPEAPGVEQILEAFVAPTIQAVAGRRNFSLLVARVLTEPGALLLESVRNIFQPISHRFGAALMRARPDLPPQEILWRMTLSIGAMMFVLTAGEKIEAISNGVCNTADLDAVSRRLVAFGAAGFNAPADPRSAA